MKKLKSRSILYFNYDISQNSFINVGGRVKYYLETDDIVLVSKIIKVAKILTIKTLYVGNSSKLLYTFDYFDGIVIKFTQQGISITESIEVGGGTYLPLLCSYFEKTGLNGLVGLKDIPGDLGGSLINNVGFISSTISSNVEKVLVIDLAGKITWRYLSQIKCSYRHIDFGEKVLICRVSFKKQHTSKKYLKLLNDIAFYIRKEAQPQDIISLGSTFKNGINFFAAKLIDENSLKSLRVNSVAVSSRHANFLQVDKNATAESLILIINIIKRRIKTHNNYEIFSEIIFI